MDVFEYSESDVLYTQLSLFQKFMKRHSLDKMTALQLFEENEVFEILSDCYESVQLDGDGEILNDIDALLRNNGATHGRRTKSANRCRKERTRLWLLSDP